MKKVTVIAFLICSVIAFHSSHLHAQALKIGVFDVQKVMRESKKIDGYRQEFTKNIETKAKPLRDKESTAKLIEEKLIKEGGKITPSERRGLEEKLANETKEVRRMKEDLEIEIRKMDSELTQKALRDIGIVIKNIADKERYTIIFEKSAAGIVHFIDSMDITHKIISEIK
jgi:outer membrane protein